MSFDIVTRHKLLFHSFLGTSVRFRTDVEEPQWTLRLFLIKHDLSVGRTELSHLRRRSVAFAKHEHLSAQPDMDTGSDFAISTK